MDFVSSEWDLVPIEGLAVAALVARPECQSDQTLRCPICGDNYVHICGSGVQQNKTLHLIASDGVHILKGMPSIGRGSALIAIYQGECQHTFASVQRFHKGQILVGFMPLPNGIKDLPTLWRD